MRPVLPRWGERSRSESERAATAGRVAAAVGDLVEPVLERPLSELGMVGEVTVGGDGTAYVTLLLPSAAWTARAELTAGVLESVGDAAVTFRLMDDGQRGQVAALLRGSGPGLRGLDSTTKVYAVASGKGGVGKSSITANLAASLAAQGNRVGVIDADVWGYSIPQLLGVSRPPVAVAGLMLPVVSHGVKIMSVGFFVGADEPVVWRGPMLHKALEQFVRDVHWGELDVLLLDLPPGTGDVPLSLLELLPSLQMLLVTTPSATVSAVAKRVGLMARDAGTPLTGVIENMSAATCPSCGHVSPVFGSGAGTVLAAELDVPLLGQVPLDGALQASFDGGVPVVVAEPSGAAAQVLRGVAAGLPNVRRSLVRRQLPVFVTKP